MLSQLTPIQLLIWIVGLEVLSVPIIAFLATWIINSAHNRRVEFFGLLMKGFGQIISEMTDKKRKDEK